MRTFGEYLEAAEEEKDIRDLLSRLPPSHAALVQGYAWRFQPGNVLAGDSQHIGQVSDQDRQITLAAPWNYGREFAALHEVGHKVWERLVPPRLKKVWLDVVKKTEGRLPPDIRSQDPEELFCHSYAQFYAKNKIEKYNHPEWMAFIKILPA
jgi:hypothetical protein